MVSPERDDSHMKKIPIPIMLTIYFLLFCTLCLTLATRSSADIDYFSENVERLKEEGDFENWPGKNGPVRAGIILSKDHFSSLQEAEEDDIPIIRIMDDIEGILATRYSYSWTVKDKGKVRVRIHVMQTCLQAQNFLIWRFATSNMANVHLPSRGERYGIHAGDISFASDDSIDFVRNNIHVEIDAYDEMENELKEIAEDLDQLLLSRPTGEDARELMPVIKRFHPVKHPMKPDETSDLFFEIETPAKNYDYLELKPLQECLDKIRVTDVNLSNDQILFKWKATEGDIYLEKHDLGNNYYYCSYHYASEMEGLHTITLIVSYRETGLISEAQTIIEVRDNEKIDERFWDFLLTADEVPGYRLKEVYRRSSISLYGLGYVVNQKWASIDEDIDIDLTMEIFDSEETAMRGMNSYMDTAEPWIWGSVYGGILGNNSWRTVNSNSGVIFSYGNIGIRMSTNKYKDGESTLRINQKAITDLALIQIKRIDRNLSPEIIENRESLRQTRLSPAEYNRYMAEAVNVNLNGYQLITNEDSLWLLKDEGVRMGIRREWRNSQGNVIGVDICKLESNTMATDTASERRKMWIGFFGDQESNRIIVRGSAVTHVYYLNHEYSAARKISPPYYSSTPPISSYMNPIYYDRLGLTFIYYNNPYYNRGSLYSRFPATTYSNISLRYPYNANVYHPNLPSYVWNSAVPSYVTAGYNYPAYYPGRYAFSINSKEPYGGYTSPSNYNHPLYRYAPFNPYRTLSSDIFNLLASSNLGTALKGIELMHNYWPLF